MSARESASRTGTLRINTHPILSLDRLTIFVICRLKVVVLLIVICADIWLVLSCRYLYHDVIYLVVVDFICCYFFFYRRSSNLLVLNFILFESSISTVYVNYFLASGCLPHLLFLEEFGYHQRRIMLMSQLFRYLYQIRVLEIGRIKHDPSGMPLL